MQCPARSISHGVRCVFAFPAYAPARSLIGSGSDPIAENAPLHFRHDINFMRAIAVALVVLYHFGVPQVRGGFIGVDVFFVISGYLMTGIIVGGIRKGSFSLMSFYVARARRIVPALASVVAVVMACGWFLLNPGDYKRLGLSGAAALTFVSNMLFWRTTDYFNDNASELFLHTWSLSVEWQFYLAFPLLILGFRRITTSDPALRTMLWVVGAVSLALAVVAAPSFPSLAFYGLPTRAWEMIVGGLVCLYAGRRPGKRASHVLFWVALASILYSATAFSSSMAWPGAWALVPTIATATILLLHRDDPLMRMAPLQAAGSLSYSIYLWHWPAMLLFTRFAPLPSTTGRVALALGATMLLSWLSYRYVERGRWGRPVHLGLSRRGLACLSLTVALVGAGAWTWHADGYLDRGAGTPDTYRAILAAQSDWEYPASCGYKASSHQLQVCEVGPPTAAVRTLFVGDSHAEQWYARYAMLAKDRKDFHVTFATYGGCPPFTGVNRTAAGFDCPAFLEQVEQLARSGRWEHVIVHGFWPAYFVRLDDGSQRPLLCSAEQHGCPADTLTVGRDDELLKHSLGATLRVLAEQSKQVVVVLPSPAGEANLVQLKLDSDFRGQPFPLRDGIDLQAFRNNTRQVRELVSAAAAETGAVIVDPLDHLCINGRCPVLDANGQLLYRDGNHYRASVAKTNAQFLDRFILTE